MDGTRDTYGAVIEDCVVEQPGHNNYWNSTFLGFGGNEDENGLPVPTLTRGCLLRNNFVDCRFDYGAAPVEKRATNNVPASARCRRLAF